MKLLLETEKLVWQVGETITMRLIALNDSYEGVILDRRLLIGPNATPAKPTGAPLPISVEPAAPQADQNLVFLNPFCLYGRDRTFTAMTPGQLHVYGYLLREATDALGMQGPAQADLMSVAAPPLVLTIQA